MSEIVYVGEKSKYRSIGWPGDEYHEKTLKTTTESSKQTDYDYNKTIKSKGNDYRKMPYNNKAHFDRIEDKRPSSMKSRYFSIENKIQETETQTSNETSEKISESFKERRDYLIKKLLQSRTLPELATDSTSTQISTQIVPTTSESANEKETQNENTTNQPIDNIPKTSRKHSFQDEYIPLFNLDKTETKLESDNESVVLDEPDSPKRKIYNPKLNTIENYKGTYSMKCLMRTRQYLIDCFKPYSTTYSRSNFEDRLFEIVKLKLNIKSKFDDDKKLLKKIRRETALEKQIIYDRIESQNRRTKSFQASAKQKNKHARFEEDSDSDCIIETEPKKRKKTVVTIDLEQSGNEDEEDSASDLIQLISNQETFEKLDYEEDIDDEDFSYDEDSKCIQFGNYSKKKEHKTSKKKKVNSSTLSREEKETKTTNEKSNVYRLNRVGLAATSSHDQETNNQLIELESKYKKLRNQRNKLLRKKKGIEINTQRELMSSELKKIRSIMKKIRRKQHPKQKFEFKTSVNKSKSKLKKKKKNKTKI